MPFLETQYKDEKGCLLPKTDLSFTPGKDKMSSVLGYWWKGKEETCVVGEHRDKGLFVAAAGCAADTWCLYRACWLLFYTFYASTGMNFVNIGYRYSGRGKAVRSIILWSIYELHVHYTKSPPSQESTNSPS